MIRTKRVYEPPSPDDGHRVLVERLWPRGFTKAAVAADAWLKDVAPSPDLRKWYAHDVARWEEFVRRYRAELDANPEVWAPLLAASHEGPVTLLFSARDAEHNSARALKGYLEERR